MFFCKRSEKKYHCLLNKIIFHDEKGSDISEDESSLLIARLELPFPPYKGLKIQDFLSGKIEEGWRLASDIEIDKEFYSGVIDDIVWNNELEQFECFVEKKNLTSANKIGAVLYHHLRSGWDYDLLSKDERKIVGEYIKMKEKNDDQN